MQNIRFFICRHCGNIVGMIHDSGAPLTCCGEKMHELAPNTTEAATEKHIPVVTVDGNQVRAVVGSVEHPMLEEHYIQWLYLQTTSGGQRVQLEPGQKPEACFALADGQAPVTVYAYCNIHGLWKMDV